ncbi:MAG: hypothetical protein NWF04_02365 [Candidatus Bathyarchaeota archaeon]|nr:hypothetical protein [Candidatus Bathyarchaeota archaeon]
MTIPLLDVAFSGVSEWSLSERDVDVLAFLGEEEFEFFTFEGLKRRLGLHPETLSRILSRLEQEGIVKKSSRGYQVTKELTKNLKAPVDSSRGSAVLLQTFLPSDMPVEQLISNLQGRWFGLLRWLGLAQSSEDVTLKWVTDEGDVQVDAKVTLNTLSIEAKFLRGYNQDLALRATYQLMNHIGKLCSRSHAPAPMAQHVGYFGSQDYSLLPS